MDGGRHGGAPGADAVDEILRVAQASASAPSPLDDVVRGLGPGPFALVCLFVSPDADFVALSADAPARFGDADVIACTTAGEIGRDGYEDGQIIAIAFPSDLFAVDTYTVEGLDTLDESRITDELIQRRIALANAAAPEMESEFAFLLVDGLSMREEYLAAMLSRGLGSMPLFGGSAGDGERFGATWLMRNGRVLRNAALVSLVRSRCPVRVFTLDHLTPTATRMVVTAADPARRVVREINAEPAAREYARLLGKDPAQLDPFTFAAYPVAVRLGDTHHVRAIRQVGDNEELVFFSAIEEGMVLTLAHPEDMAEHLDRSLAALAEERAPAHVLACDCILRRIAAGQSQQTRAISRILALHNVSGFSTYGEQYGGLHVNQTLTGVAIYPPER
ncbi:FIST N domain protein [Roseivivax jejudonensis]|uniref:FIST N domain protein n=1 Tax=Roseivivax jejudonensis TaxID=1529041 RepID=A0A1X6Z0F4_9RHOB|nr:FIST N-terminal domain-containing protein [Roseivivax jejudonensis]SLN36738.1 FIST N domain protein [Roseivivax jejudonensis]